MARKIDVSLISGNGGSNGQLLGANTGNVSFQSVFTGNVIESGNTSSGNVYFSNARAIGALVAGDNISIAANGQISANLSAVSVSSVTGNLNVSGNVIANGFVSTSASAGLITSTGNITMTAAGAVNINSTNVIASGNVIASKFFGDGSSLTGVGASSFSGNTNGITEGTNNLFYTNTRVVSNTLALLPTLAGSGISIAANGQISSAWQNTSTTANVTFGALNVTGPANFYGNVTTYSSNNLSISDNMIYLNSASQSSNPDLGFAGNYNDGTYRHTGFFRDASDGNWKVFDSYTPEPDANIFIDTAHASFRLANIQANTVVGVAGVFSGNVSAGNLTTGSGTGGSFTGANLISAGNISATTWLDLYTANVIESDNNIFYTNARVLSNITAYLAANPQTSASAFGNANVGAFLTTYTGNISASNINVTGNIRANGFLATGAGSGIITATGDFTISAGGNINLFAANVFAANNIIANTFIAGAGAGGSLTGANLVSAGNVTAITTFTGNITGQSATFTSNIAAGNLVLTGGIIDNVGVLTISTTSNSNIELSAAGTGRILLDGQAWPHTDGVNGYSLQTNGTGNLFWGVSAGSFSNANVGAYLTTYTGNISAGNVIANGFISTSASAGLISSTGNITMTAAGAVIINSTNVIASGNVIANTFISTGAGSATLSSTGNVNISGVGNISLNTGNVIVSGNVIASKFFGDGSSLTGVGASSFSGNTNSITEGTNNLYYTNARVNAQVESNLRLKANVVDLTTANVGELNNLYYTNARVVSNVIAYLAANPAISTYGNANVGAFLTTYTGNIAGGNLVLTGGIIDNVGVLSISTTSNSNIELSAAGNGRIILDGQAWPHTDGVNGYVLQTNGTGNLFWAVAASSFANANVGAFLTTYTGNISAGNVIANTIISPTATAATITSTGNLNITAAEAINLTTPNVLVSGNVVANNFISTGSGSGEVTSTSNLLLSASGNLNLTSSNVFVNGNLVLRGGLTGLTLTTSSIAEGSNLYYTNARVLSNIVAALPTYTGNIAAGNLILTGGIIDNVGVLSISTTGNSNIELAANGTGRIILDGQAWPDTDGVNGYVLQTNGTGNLFWGVSAGSFSNANVGAFLTTYTGNISAGNVIANSFVSPTATSATLTSTGNLNITAAGTVNLTTSNVIASGNIIANTFISVGAGSGEVTSTSNLLLSGAGNLNLTAPNVFVNGNLVLRGGLTGLTLTTSSIAEGSNLYYTNARVYSNVIGVLSSYALTANLNTANVNENAASGNLYYNNARVYSNVVAALTTYTGNIAAGNLVLTGGIIDNVGVLTISTTSNSNIELSAAGNGRIILDGQAWPHTDGVNGYSLQTNGTGNLFWAAPTASSSFANANVAAFLTTYTGNISAGNVLANTILSPSATSGTLNSTGNLNIIAQNNTINLTASNVLASGNIIANTFIATGTGSAELSTSSNLLLSATGNLNLSGGNIFVNSPITFRGTVTGIASASVTQANLTTANVAELASSGNLYYTNARVYSNVIAALPTYTGNIAAGNLILTGGIVDNVGVLTITTTGNSNIELIANGTGRILLDGQAWPHTDGVNGYSLQTNGTGNLFWAAPAASFANANVGAFLTTYTGNVRAGNVIANTLVGNAIIGTGSGAGGINSTGNLVIYSTGTIIAQSPFRFSGYANVNILANTSIGDTVYNTAANALVVYTSSGWTTVGSGGAGGSAAAAVGYSLIFGG